MPTTAGCPWWVNTLLFQYYTPKLVKVQVWQFGLLYRIAQIAILIYVIYQFVQAEQYVVALLPLGAVNAWAVDGGMSEVTASDVLYCNNASYSYMYDPEFVLDSPTCVSQPYQALVAKRASQLLITTAQINTDITGWPCDAQGTGNSADPDAAQCSDGVFGRKGTQCTCLRERPFFSLGVDQIGVQMESWFSLNVEAYHDVGLARDEPLAGSCCSTNKMLETYFKTADGSLKKFAGGKPIAMTLAEILGNASISLDERNHEVTPDYRDGKTPPFYRTTGITIDAQIKFTNRDWNTRKPNLADVDNVRAELSYNAEKVGWASRGPNLGYTLGPIGDPGNQTYRLSGSYPLDVIINFHTSGKMFYFSFEPFLYALISAMVLLGLARTVADALALHSYYFSHGQLRLAPTSLVVARKKFDATSVPVMFALRGLRAAVAVGLFKSLDVDGDGVLDVNDLETVMLSSGSVDEEQASRIANTIMRVGDQDGGGDGKGTLSFVEFATLLDQDQVPFNRYLDLSKSDVKFLYGDPFEEPKKVGWRLHRNKAGAPEAKPAAAAEVEVEAVGRV